VYIVTTASSVAITSWSPCESRQHL